LGEDVEDSATELPEGLDIIVQVYVKASRSASVLAEPSSEVKAAKVTFWLMPALATGAELAAAAVTVVVVTVLSSKPSLTIRLAT
jgi:hypothetical protein